MRILIFIFIGSLITSCASTSYVAPETTYFETSNEKVTTNNTSNAYKGIDMTNVGGTLNANEQILDPKKINNDYKEALRRSKCEKKFWARYEFGNYFGSLASINKITPYDIIAGDDYARRNISKMVWYEAFDNYTKYLSFQFPEAVKNKFDQEMSNDQEKKRNERLVFNEQVKRDYECYKKLK